MSPGAHEAVTASHVMNLLRHAIHRTVVDPVLGVAPFQRLPVQVSNVVENAVNKEILFHEPHEPFHLAFGKRMAGLAELCLETNGFHEGFIILLPHWMPLQIAVQNYTFHVVGQNKPGNTHILKGVDHADKQIFLPCVGEKLDVALSAMVTDHGEAGCAVGLSAIVQNVCKAPVYLVGLSRSRRIAPPTVPLRCDLLPLGGDEMLVRGDVLFYDCCTTVKPNMAQPIQYDRRVFDALLKQAVNDASITTKLCVGMLSTFRTAGQVLEPVSLEPSQFPAGHAASPLQFRQIDTIQRKTISLFCFHFFNGLCYT